MKHRGGAPNLLWGPPFLDPHSPLWSPSRQSIATEACTSDLIQLCLSFLSWEMWVLSLSLNRLVVKINGICICKARQAGIRHVVVAVLHASGGLPGLLSEQAECGTQGLLMSGGLPLQVTGSLRPPLSREVPALSFWLCSWHCTHAPKHTGAAAECPAFSTHPQGAVLRWGFVTWL